MSKSYVRYNCPGSSVIDYVSYQKDSETLNVKFKSGGVYSYHGVSQNRFTRLCKSDSIGSYFHEFVKGKYPVTGPRNFELERTLNQQLLDTEVVASVPSVNETVRQIAGVFVNGAWVLFDETSSNPPMSAGFGNFSDAERVTPSGFYDYPKDSE